MSDVSDGEGMFAVTHSKTVTNVNVSLLLGHVDYNQCYVRSPMEEMEIVLVIVLAQHTTQTSTHG